MDCGTCESSSPVQVMTPEVVDVNLSISNKAQEMLSDAFGDDRSMALLVGVLSGGCSGYMYDLQIVEDTDQSCQEINIDGFRVLVPNASSHLLDGIEIDYVDRLMGGGFKINNPNAESSCGCGESFAWGSPHESVSTQLLRFASFREGQFAVYRRIINK